MSAESGDDANDSNKQNSDADQSLPKRKVAKTMMENQIPQIPTDEAESSPADNSEQPRKVAKTMLELSMPTRDEIEAASKKPEQARAVPKTMIEIERPNLDTQIPQSDSAQESARTANDAQRAVPKTMMEVSLPSQSDTLKMVRKVAKTRLDSKSLDAIGAKATKESGDIKVKVRKTLTGEQFLPNLSGDNLTQIQLDAGNPSNIEAPAPARQRFVAKTMLDHSVLSEQLAKSHEKEKMRAAYIAQVKANEPQKEFLEIECKKMAMPCAWEWTESGVNRGRVRACDKCQTNVYDFSGMEMPEAEALVFKHESRKKFKLYKRQDGKYMTRDCPVQSQKKRNFLLLIIAATIVIVAAVAAMLLAPPPAKPPEQAQTDTKSTTESGSTTSSATMQQAEGIKTLDTFKPAKDGVMHFDAGEDVKPTPQSNGIFTSVGGDLPSKSGGKAKSNQSDTNSPMQLQAPAPMTTTATSGENDSKYWDN